VGTLLGDGHLETQTRGNTYRLRVEHSEKQKEYLFWLYNEFKEWVPQEPKRKVRADGRVSYEMVTVNHGAFRFYAHQFYVDGKKKIPVLLAKMLTPLGLAIWYMDDGSIKSSRHNTFNIHTLGYAKHDLERVRKIFKDSFGIATALHSQKHTSWRLYIPSESSVLFTSLVYPTMKLIPSMLYKLKNTMPKK
jgi:recombination protein RecA